MEDSRRDAETIDARTVFTSELKSIRSRWSAAYPTNGEGEQNQRSLSADAVSSDGGFRPSVEHELVGLGFSGGGIRSATINMGVAQALHKHGVFDHADYMSTVSGGGYLGSSISALMRTAGAEFPYEYPWPPERPEGRSDPADPSPAESPYLTWVRNHSNYMVTRGFLDYLRMASVLVRGVALNFLILVPVLLLIALVLAFIYAPLLLDWSKELPWDGTHHLENRASWAPAFWAQGFWEAWMSNNWMKTLKLRPDTSYLFTPWVALLGAVWFLAFPVVIRLFKVFKYRPQEIDADAPDLQPERPTSESSVKMRDWYELSFGKWMLWVGVVALVESLPLLIHGFHKLNTPQIDRGLIASLLAGSSVVSIAAIGKLMAVLKKFARTLVVGLVAVLGLVLPLLVILYTMEFLVYKESLQISLWALAIVPVVLLLGLIASIVIRIRKGGVSGAGWMIKLLGGLAATLVVLYVANGLLTPKAWLVFAAMVEIWLFCKLVLDVNLTSVHGLYRDRLASAYLVGEDLGGRVDIEDDIDLQDICQQGSKAPYHLLNVAHNLQGSDDPSIRDRNSDFFIFSKKYFGGPRTGWASTDDLEAVFPQMDLAGAMAISAAAASPNMGTGTSAPLVTMMTLFNVRLGYWVPNPRRLNQWRKDKYEKAAIKPSLANRFYWRVPPSAFLQEMRSRLNETDRWVNLSDGGHIENLATIELLRRRCKYIITGDGEADPDLHFGGLATLIRYARIDLGVEIDIETSDLRLSEDRLSSKHCALGTITYPALHRRIRRNEPGECSECRGALKGGDDGSFHCPAGETEIGHLLYVKSSVTGDEDEVITQYRSRNRDFPHESTADQFFDEGQFEAYRSLGYHIGNGLFDTATPIGTGEIDTFEKFEDWFSGLKEKLSPKRGRRQALGLVLKEQSGGDGKTTTR
jgi:hypothetical protein